MTEERITKLLAERHHEDIFVPQCKNGPTHIAQDLLIMDAWAMKKSWNNPKLTAYEIKVSRSDFLGDEKWKRALECCNEFYWVAPQGLIDPAEVAADCGLMVVARTGNRLFIKRRAVHRQIEPPLGLIDYVLMCRTVITRERNSANNIEFWRDWLAVKDEEKEVGRRASRKLQQITNDRIKAVEYENKRLRTLLEEYQAAHIALTELGLIRIDESPRGPVPDVLASQWRMKESILEAMNLLPHGITESLRSAAEKIEETLEKCRSLSDPGVALQSHISPGS